MKIVCSSLLLCLLIPVTSPASDIDAMRARQQQLQDEIRQLQRDQTKDRTRLQHLKMAIEQQRERNRALDAQLQQASDRTLIAPENTGAGGK